MSIALTAQERRGSKPQSQKPKHEPTRSWDQYQAHQKITRERSGCEAADRAVKDLLSHLHDLEERIARTRAQTIEGVIWKARMAEADPCNDNGLEDDLEDVLEARESTATFIGHSIILDILRLHGDQE